MALAECIIFQSIEYQSLSIWLKPILLFNFQFLQLKLEAINKK